MQIVVVAVVLEIRYLDEFFDQNFFFIKLPKLFKRFKFCFNFDLDLNSRQLLYVTLASVSN